MKLYYLKDNPIDSSFHCLKMTPSPLVSIVMCVYNGERFLKDQLDSILRQSYGNIELICVDDHSSDNSLEILKSYAQKDARVKVFQNAQNIGFNKNFERGISLSKGDFISISDQDDIWYPNKIEDLVLRIADGLLIYSNSELIDEGNNRLHQKLDLRITHVHHPTFKGFLEYNFVTGHTCLFKKELLQYIIPLPEQVFYYDWWISLTASYLGKVKYYDKVLTQYRIHSGSVIQTLKEAQPSKISEKAKRHCQALSFANANFIHPADKDFILGYLQMKENATNGASNFIKSYLYLLKYHNELYPWYKKSFISKLNFIRRQCL